MDWKKAKRAGRIEDRRINNRVIARKLSGMRTYDESGITPAVQEVKIYKHVGYKKEIPYDDG